MTKDELARAINGAFYGGPDASRGMPLADAIDAYVRGLIARCRRVTVYSPAAAKGEEAPVERLKIDDEPSATIGPELARDLLALVEAQTEALLETEWSDWADDGNGSRPFCPGCGMPSDGRPRCGEDDELTFTRYAPGTHWSECRFDACLTAAGYPDQPSRDAKRAEIAKRREEKK